MAKISIRDWSKGKIAEYYRENKKNLRGAGVNTMQILIALLDHTPGFAAIPEVRKAKEDCRKWSAVYHRMAGLVNPQQRWRPEDEAIIEAAIAFDTIPFPQGGEPNLDYLHIALREKAIAIHSELYEARHEEKKTSLGDMGIEFKGFGG